MIEWILDNKEWVFSGVGVAIVAGIAGLIWRSRRRHGGNMKQKSGDHSVNLQCGKTLQVSDTRGSHSLAGGPGSINVQAEAVNISQGLSVANVADISRRVFRENFPKLAKQAQAEVERRFGLIENQLIEAIEARLEEHEISRFGEPDVQYNLYEVLKEGCRHDSEHMRKQLADLLVKRVKVDNRDLERVIFNEAIATVPRLTPLQLNILAGIVCVSAISGRGVNTWDDYVKSMLDLFVKLIPAPPLASDMAHLQYAGCIGLGIGQYHLGKAGRSLYPWIFERQINEDDLKKGDLVEPILRAILVQDEQDSSLYHFPHLSMSEIEEAVRGIQRGTGQLKRFKTASYSEKEEKTLLNLLWDFVKDKKSCLAMIKECEPGMQVVDAWQKSNLKNASLTSVGVVLGVSRLEITTGGPISIDEYLGSEATESAMEQGAGKDS